MWLPHLHNNYAIYGSFNYECMTYYRSISICLAIIIVLCVHIQAKSLFPDLVSADHAWILPAYYNPNWWKLHAGMESECSNEDMRTILESVIFVDTVKYPPVVM